MTQPKLLQKLSSTRTLLHDTISTYTPRHKMNTGLSYDGYGNAVAPHLVTSPQYSSHIPLDNTSISNYIPPNTSSSSNPTLQYQMQNQLMNNGASNPSYYANQPMHSIHSIPAMNGSQIPVAKHVPILPFLPAPNADSIAGNDNGGNGGNGGNGDDDDDDDDDNGNAAQFSNTSDSQRFQPVLISRESSLQISNSKTSSHNVSGKKKKHNYRTKLYKEYMSSLGKQTYHRSIASK